MQDERINDKIRNKIMQQTFYIEADEEIISVIGHLRKSPSEENIFVFPKRALVLQSVINLRLFQREAQKLGKKIIIVSQDEVGRMLCEKVGIATENYSEDFFRKDSHLELAPEKNVSQAAVSSYETQKDAPSSNSIGSADFHTPPADIAPLAEKKASPSLSKNPVTLRVRNASPPKLTSLNSKRLEEVLKPKGILSSDRGERLKNFYSGMRSMPVAPNSEKEIEQTTVPVVGAKASRIFFILGAVSLISLAGVGLFLFLPKAEIYVTPYKITDAADIEITDIPVRILEKDKDITFTVATTGKSGGVNQKARGTVIIYNNHSADPQPLVATTRLETEDGKLFRLVSGVTVPGMTNKDGKKEAGVIEAEVIADQTGEEYNIGASTFRIPGFKGSPKYDSFSAKSVKTMAGGGSTGTADLTVVAKVDIDAAFAQAKEKAKEEFLNAARGELSPDEKILEEQMDIAELSAAAMPQIGTAAIAFEYKNTFKVRAFVFSEKAVREKIESTSEKNLRGVRFKPVSSSITYSESLPNFSDGTLRLVARALVTMESDIDRDALKEKLLGQNKDDMQKTLSDFPGVKKLEVTFYPEWFVKSIPNSKNRVTIIVKPGETQE